MSMRVKAERIELLTGARKKIEEPVATEVPINIYVNDRYLITLLATPKLQRELVNDRYLITLLATPKLQRELALGWLFDEGVLQSLDEIREVTVDKNDVSVKTNESLQEGKLQAIGVTRILTTACGTF